MGLLDIVFTKRRLLNGKKMPTGARKLEKVNKDAIYKIAKKAMSNK